MPSVPINIEFIGVVSSTMEVARDRIATSLGKPFGIVAESQLQGRGTGGRTWKSPKGNMYMTICVPQANDVFLCPGLQSVLPILCGIASRRAMLELLPNVNPAHIKTKWPNDVIYHGQKIGGTLIESDGGYFLIGMGMNVEVAPVVDDAGRESTTLNNIARDAGSPSTTPQMLAEKIWQKLFELTTDTTLTRAAVVKEFGDVMDYNIQLHKRTASGRDPEPLTAVGLNEWGHLTVRHQDGTTLSTLCTDYLF